MVRLLGCGMVDDAAVKCPKSGHSPPSIPIPLTSQLPPTGQAAPSALRANPACLVHGGLWEEREGAERAPVERTDPEGTGGDLDGRPEPAERMAETPRGGEGGREGDPGGDPGGEEGEHDPAERTQSHVTGQCPRHATVAVARFYAAAAPRYGAAYSHPADRLADRLLVAELRRLGRGRLLVDLGCGAGWSARTPGIRRWIGTELQPPVARRRNNMQTFPRLPARVAARIVTGGPRDALRRASVARCQAVAIVGLWGVLGHVPGALAANWLGRMTYPPSSQLLLLTYSPSWVSKNLGVGLPRQAARLPRPPSSPPTPTLTQCPPGAHQRPGEAGLNGIAAKSARRRWNAWRALEARSMPVPHSGCFVWLGGVVQGYGRVQDRPAHRLAYELFHGKIPKGRIVCHRCDVRACWNPAHLYAGTPADNVRDALERLPGLRERTLRMLKEANARRLAARSEQYSLNGTPEPRNDVARTQPLLSRASIQTRVTGEKGPTRPVRRGSGPRGGAPGTGFQVSPGPGRWPRQMAWLCSREVPVGTPAHRFLSLADLPCPVVLYRERDLARLVTSKGWKLRRLPFRLRRALEAVGHVGVWAG